MNGGIRTLVLRLAATAVLFAPAVAAQAQGYGQTICRDVWVPGRVGAIDPNERGHTERVCNTVSYSPPPTQPTPPPEPKVEHTTGSSEEVHYDGAAEARKAQMRVTEPAARASATLCPPPYRMTARDGCQR